MIELRDYQTELIRDIRVSLVRRRSAVAVLGCGGGKSVIQAEIARLATARGNRVLFLVHRRELCEQILGTFTAQGVDMELCDIMMVQTATRRVDTLPQYALIITDEAHHSTAKSYTRIYERYPQAKLVGFTATPIRLDRGGLGEVYDDLIESVSTRWLIDNGYLSDYRYYSAPLADTSKLHTRAGEFRADEVAELMSGREIYGRTVEQWERLAKGRKTIVYCASVETSGATAEEFRAAGHTAYSLDGTTPKSERESVMERFRSGDITVLCNCELFGEGLDVPDCECTVLLRPTQSLTVYLQQAMRSMRYLPGKTAVIIDHVGSCYRHGLPDDPREWTLEPKHKQETTVKIRECRECFAVYSPKLDSCPYCGAEASREIQTRERKTIDIDLQEVRRREDIRSTRLQDAELTSWEQVREFQQVKGYKFAWCLHYAEGHGISVPPKYRYMRRFMR